MAKADRWTFEILTPQGAWEITCRSKAFRTENAAARACRKYVEQAAEDGFHTTGRVIPLVEQGCALVDQVPA